MVEVPGAACSQELLPPAQTWEQEGTADTEAQSEVVWAVLEGSPTLLGARGDLQCVRV